MRTRRIVTVIVLVLLIASLAIVPALAVGDRPAGRRTTGTRVPVLAFYYIWFDAGSWDRAKIDYPAIGRYSSDDPTVIREQIRAAKDAGIDGFIVSWKSTPTNNRRLRLLMTIAAEEQFKLAMIYQGLDFSRQPLPVDRVAADFALFRDTFADDPVFLRIEWQAVDHLQRNLGVRPRRGRRRHRPGPRFVAGAVHRRRASTAISVWRTSPTATPITGHRSTRRPTRATRTNSMP